MQALETFQGDDCFQAGIRDFGVLAEIQMLESNQSFQRCDAGIRQSGIDEAQMT